MSKENIDVELIDLMDTLSFTLGKTFIDKWRHKYGERLLRLFQFKILNSLENQKPLKLKSIFKYLNKDSGFSPELVKNFFMDIDYEIYFPIISGSLKSIDEERKIKEN
jgi:hypothetical protein